METMNEPMLTTYAHAARILGTGERVISGLVAAHGLKPKPFPSNGRAKGLDAADMAVLRKALGKTGRREKATA